MDLFWLLVVLCAFILFLVGIWILHRFYAKATLDMAIVRTGVGGCKVLLDGGCIAFPIVHQVQKIGMSTRTMTIACEGKESLRTKDQMRVDICMQFEFTVQPIPESIVKVAQIFGPRLGLDHDIVRELLSGSAIDSMQSAMSTRNLETIHQERSAYTKEVLETIKSQAKSMGLELVSASLLKFDQADLAQFDENNVFNATAQRKLAEVVSKERKERIQIETTTEIEIAESQLARRQRQLELDRAEREARISQEAELTKLEHDTYARTEKQKHTSEMEAKKAELDKQQKIKLAEVQHDEEARRAEMTAILALEQENINHEVAVAEKRTQISVAKAKEETARSAYLLAAEATQTEKERAIVERERDISLLKQKNQGAVAIEQMQSEARVAALRLETEEKTTKTLAKVAQYKMEAEASGRKAQIEAENILSDAIIAMRIEEKRLEHLPEIMTQMMKPVEKIDSIKINHIGGLGHSLSNQGDHQSFGATTAFSSAMDQILGMAVTLPAMKQMGEEIGVDFDANLAGRTADYANRIKAKKGEK